MIEHINARSLLSCFDEIKLLIIAREIDILCITETWLHPEIPDRFINIEGFNLFRCDGGKGAGSCIYVRTDLTSIQLKDIFPHTRV